MDPSRLAVTLHPREDGEIPKVGAILESQSSKSEKLKPTKPTNSES